MHKLFIFIFALMIVAVALYIHSCVEPFPFKITTTSPERNYEVMLKERAELSWWPLDWSGHDNHNVQLTVMKNGKTMIESETIFSGRAFDSRFRQNWPNQAWQSNNVLQFTVHDFSPSLNRDQVFVTNDTDHALSYFRVDARDMFLLLELGPHSSVRLFATPQTDKIGDTSWVGCFGRFDDGRVLRYEGKNFIIRGKYVSPAHYSISIRDIGVVIESKEFEPYRPAR